MKRRLIVSAVPLTLAAAVLACSRGTDLAPTPTLLPYSIPVTYLNVSLVTPPYYSNKVIAEKPDLREQLNAADEVPVYVRINIREGNGYFDEADPQRTPYYSPASQILVYPVVDLLATWPESAQAVKDLETILGPGDAPLPTQLPFWPLFGFSGVSGRPLESLGRPTLTAQRMYLAFGSGRGARYVTLLEQDPPRTYRLSGLIYTFQGLTDDRKYYVSVILPVSVNDSSPLGNETAQALESLAEQPAADYEKIAQGLERVAPSQFGLLSLAQCDALVKSLVVSP